MDDKFLYLLKIKGSGNITDYIQVRDELMHLIGYFKHKNWINGLDKAGLSEHQDFLGHIFDELSYGVITEIKLQPL